MPIKHTDFVIQGMFRDTSEHAFDSKFAYENQNLRITTEPNSDSEHTGNMYALTNEKGNKYTPIIGLENQDMDGIPIGQCTLNNQWVVFYTSRPETVEFSESAIESSISSGDNIYLVYDEQNTDNLVKKSDDKIYRLWMNDGKTYGELLYQGNLGFDCTHPLETIGYYENESIQKVYWTDGLNQPRFINIVEKDEKKAKWNDYSFDFVPVMDLLNHKVTITENQTGGKFPAGMIQWHFTYSRQFGQETAIFESTKLYELKFKDRGAAPDEQTSQSFEIKLSGLDNNFDFVNIYSLIRTSLDSVPIAKLIATLPIKEEFAVGPNGTQVSLGYIVKFTDTNLYGAAIDPQELLYKGGETITAYTMENKDNTLFLGNYNLKRSVIPLDVREHLKEFATNTNSLRALVLNNTGNLKFKQSEYIDIDGDLAKFQDICYFRNGNIYRLGIQFQHKTGKWSEVVWLGDYKNTVGINYIGAGLYMKLKYAIASMHMGDMVKSSVDTLVDLGYVRARPVVVYPNMTERNVIFQGVLGNCLYFSKDEQKIYPDYFFRFMSDKSYSSQIISELTRGWYQKICSYYPKDYVRLDGSILENRDIHQDEYCVSSLKSDSENILKYKRGVYNIYSPDFEFDDSIKLMPLENIKLREYTCNQNLYIQKCLTETLTSSISKSITGRPQFKSDTKALYFNDKISQKETLVSSLSEYAFDFWESTAKFSELEDDGITYSGEVITSSFWGYAVEDYWSLGKTDFGLNYNIGDFVSTTTSDSDKYQFITRYPTRTNGFVPKLKSPYHYVGGFIWDDILFNFATVHSDLLNKDIPNRAASFMQMYFKYTYPILLWQPSGSICYDPDIDASSVLKSNKTLNYFSLVTSNGSLNPKTLDINKIVSVIGRNIIKLDNDNDATLYSMNVDNIILFDTKRYAIIDEHKNFRWKTTPIIHDDYITPYKSFRRNNWVQHDDEGKPYFDTTMFVDLLESYNGSDGLPYDRRSDKEYYFKWHEYYEDSRFQRSADVKYLSTPHVVLTINDDNFTDYFHFEENKTIPIVNIERDVDTTSIFGGYTDNVLQMNNFIICGNTVNIAEKTNAGYNPIYTSDIEWSIGDTRFQEYECLKTYPTSFENENCVTEVMKVQIESYWNMNCRYDTWKGNPTFATSPANWNLMNPIYNQKDNFFIYHGLDLSTNSINNFPNSFTWTLTKWSGDTTDKWTHITLASNMDVDGSKGEITKLIKLQDNLICFQPRGMSQILYNEREQISTGSGVPIELANSGKVSGVRYITERTGCNNKWSICKNESGLYWIDDENKAIMAWNQQLANLSDTLGFHSWINAKSSLSVWNPVDFNSFVTYYDPYNENVMFFYKDNMLSYNTQLNCFDSFFSYGNVPYYNAYNGTAFTLSNKDSDGTGTYKVWEQHKGDYNYFYVHENCVYDGDKLILKGKYDKDGKPTDYGYEPYWTTLLVNPDMPYDKVFDNIDMRTDMWNPSKELLEETFSHLEVWNEFQWNKSLLIRQVDVPKIHMPDQHSMLKKKFRVWYINIPRDIKNKGTRYYKRDRMRNTWLYVKLSKELVDNDIMIEYPYISNNKHVIHHIGVNYFV